MNTHNTRGVALLAVAVLALLDALVSCGGAPFTAAVATEDVLSPDAGASTDEGAPMVDVVASDVADAHVEAGVAEPSDASSDREADGPLADAGEAGVPCSSADDYCPANEFCCFSPDAPPTCASSCANVDGAATCSSDLQCPGSDSCCYRSGSSDAVCAASCTTPTNIACTAGSSDDCPAGWQCCPRSWGCGPGGPDAAAPLSCFPPG